MTQIWISGGEIGYNLHVVTHNENRQTMVAELTIPGGTKSEFQNMGSKGKIINLNGWTFLNNEVEQIESWYNEMTSLCYSGTKVYVSGCIITNFNKQEDASPNTFPISYSMTLREA
jgi:hypothetical protein